MLDACLHLEIRWLPRATALSVPSLINGMVRQAQQRDSCDAPTINPATFAGICLILGVMLTHVFNKASTLLEYKHERHAFTAGTDACRGKYC